MSEFKCDIGEIQVFEYDYDNYRGKEDLNGLVGEGVAFRLYAWLLNYGYDVDIWEVYNNLSGCRDGNRWDIHDNYPLFDDEELEISFVYSVNGTVWAVLYDRTNDCWFGEFELSYIY